MQPYNYINVLCVVLDGCCETIEYVTSGYKKAHPASKFGVRLFTIYQSFFRFDWRWSTSSIQLSILVLKG